MSTGNDRPPPVGRYAAPAPRSCHRVAHRSTRLRARLGVVGMAPVRPRERRVRVTDGAPSDTDTARRGKLLSSGSPLWWIVE